MMQPTITKMLTAQMRYMTQRQGVLAQNMSNIDTPSYKAQDLQKLDFAKMAQSSGPAMSMRSSSGGKSLAGTLTGSGSFDASKTRKSFEVTPSGNNVVLEEQMAKISDTGAQFQIASTLYKKFNSLYNISLGKSS